MGNINNSSFEIGPEQDPSIRRMAEIEAAVGLMIIAVASEV
jgi:hypothetical protein